MERPAPSEITRLLRQSREGQKAALDRLLPLVYAELRAIARRAMARERAGQTLEPTALVHEAYLRLLRAEVDWQDRAHFFAVAARTMRRILVDGARRRRSEKRGPGGSERTLERAITSRLAIEPAWDLVDLDRALDVLAGNDPRKAHAVELHFFAGMTYEEIAPVLEISPATVAWDLRIAKAFLRKQLEEPSPPD